MRLRLSPNIHAGGNDYEVAALILDCLAADHDHIVRCKAEQLTRINRQHPVAFVNDLHKRRASWRSVAQQSPMQISPSFESLPVATIGFGSIQQGERRASFDPRVGRSADASHRYNGLPVFGGAAPSMTPTAPSGSSANTYFDPSKETAVTLEAAESLDGAAATHNRDADCQNCQDRN